MKRLRCGVGVGLFACALALPGCATVAPNPDTRAATAAAASRIPVLGAIPSDRYRLVGRVWVDSWTTVFHYPRFATESAGVAALKSVAAERGADALINVSCAPESAWWLQKAAYLCYGDAVKLTRATGENVGE